MKKGRIQYDYHRHHIQKSKGIDLKLTFFGSRCIVTMSSLKSHKEFLKLIPSKLDRKSFSGAFGKLFPESLLQIRSEQQWADRRKVFTSMLDLNFSSKYIPMMLESTKTYLKTWKIGETVELVNQMNLITFKIIISILFGQDSHEYDSKLKYKEANGEYVELSSIDFFIKINTDLLKGFFSLKTMAFPFLNKYNMIIIDTIFRKAKELI